MLLRIVPQLLYSYGYDTDQLATFLGGMIVLFIIFGLLIHVVVTIFYCMTLQNALKAVAVVNRKMEPGMVWLMLIPGFHLIWHFFVVNNVTESIGSEFRARGVPEDPKPSFTIGLMACILPLCFWIPILNLFSGLAGFICFIIFWVKVSEYKTRLMMLPPRSADTIF